MRYLVKTHGNLPRGENKTKEAKWFVQICPLCMYSQGLGSLSVQVVPDRVVHACFSLPSSPSAGEPEQRVDPQGMHASNRVLFSQSVSNPRERVFARDPTRWNHQTQ